MQSGPLYPGLTRGIAGSLKRDIEKAYEATHPSPRCADSKDPNIPALMEWQHRRDAFMAGVWSVLSSEVKDV